MRRFARVTAVVALVVALSSRAYAGAAPASDAVHLDPARMFNPAAESLLAALFTASAPLSPIDVVLFGAPDPAAAAIPLAARAGSGTSTIAAVQLQAYAPPIQVPRVPLQRPSIAPVPAVQFAQAPSFAVHSPQPSLRVHFGRYAAYEPALQSISEQVTVPVRVGTVHFSETVSGAQAQTTRLDAVRAMQLCGTTDEGAACPYLHDESSQNIAAGTAFNVRAGNTQVDVQLVGTLGRVSNRDVAIYQYTPLGPQIHLDFSPNSPYDSSLVYYPGLADVVRHGLNARLAVPLSPAVTLGLQYGRAHYQGDYGALLAPGLDARKDTYLGNVTYRLPNSSSMITFSARRYRYQDNLAPSFNLTQTRADLSFTVKF